MTPKTKKLIELAKERLRSVNPGRDSKGQWSTDLKEAMEYLIECMEEEDGTRFTAKILRSGMIVIPKHIRDINAIEEGRVGTFNFISVEGERAPKLDD